MSSVGDVSSDLFTDDNVDVNIGSIHGVDLKSDQENFATVDAHIQSAKNHIECIEKHMIQISENATTNSSENTEVIDQQEITNNENMNNKTSNNEKNIDINQTEKDINIYKPDNIEINTKPLVNNETINHHEIDSLECMEKLVKEIEDINQQIEENNEIDKHKTNPAIEKYIENDKKNNEKITDDTMHINIVQTKLINSYEERKRKKQEHLISLSTRSEKRRRVGKLQNSKTTAEIEEEKIRQGTIDFKKRLKQNRKNCLKVRDRSQVVVPRLSCGVLTIPTSPKLQTFKRATDAKQREEKKKLKEQSINIKSIKPFKPTKPVSPRLATSKRLGKPKPIIQPIIIKQDAPVTKFVPTQPISPKLTKFKRKSKSLPFSHPGKSNKENMYDVPSKSSRKSGKTNKQYLKQRKKPRHFSFSAQKENKGNKHHRRSSEPFREQKNSNNSSNQSSKNGKKKKSKIYNENGTIITKPFRLSTSRTKLKSETKEIYNDTNLEANRILYKELSDLQKYLL